LFLFNLLAATVTVAVVVAVVVAITNFPPAIPLPPIEIAPNPSFANEALAKGAPVKLIY